MPSEIETQEETNIREGRMVGTPAPKGETQEETNIREGRMVGTPAPKGETPHPSTSEEPHPSTSEAVIGSRVYPERNALNTLQKEDNTLSEVFLMRHISDVKKGPPGLVGKLNEIIGSFNGLKLVQGEGIYITGSSDGWIIRAVKDPKTQIDPTPPGSSAPGGGGGGSGPAAPPSGTAAWQQIAIMDSNCNQLNMWVWGTTPA